MPAGRVVWQYFEINVDHMRGVGRPRGHWRDLVRRSVEKID